MWKKRLDKWLQGGVRVRNGLAALGLWVAVFILPLKIKQLPEAWHWWASIMPDQETLWIIFSGVLVAWIFWIDLRPVAYGWWQSRNEGEVPLRDAIRWIENNSAWWRWKIAQGLLGQNEWTNYNMAASRLWRQAKEGKLIITARREKEIQRENVSKDFWQLARLYVVRDEETLWEVVSLPIEEIPGDVEKKIKEFNFVHPNVQWSDIKKLWPQTDRQTDRLMMKILKQKAKGLPCT